MIYTFERLSQVDGDSDSPLGRFPLIKAPSNGGDERKKRSDGGATRAKAMLVRRKGNFIEVWFDQTLKQFGRWAEQ